MKPWASALDTVSSVGVATSPKVASPRIRKTPRRAIIPFHLFQACRPFRLGFLDRQWRQQGVRSLSGQLSFFRLCSVVTVLVATERRMFVPGHLGEAQKQTTNVVNVW
jgi:hypothetical protein